MRFLRSLLAVGIFALPLYASIVDTFGDDQALLSVNPEQPLECAERIDYSLEIKPQTDAATYEMNVNSIVTFQAQGSGKNSETNEVVSAEVGKAWWDFDKSILLKISSEKNSISLKAIKVGTCHLAVNTTVNNQPFTKSITILVK